MSIWKWFDLWKHFRNIACSFHSWKIQRVDYYTTWSNLTKLVEKRDMSNHGQTCGRRFADVIWRIPNPTLKSKDTQFLTAEKIVDSPIKSHMKLGPQTNLGAESQSEWTIELVPKSWKMALIIPQHREGTWTRISNFFQSPIFSITMIRVVPNRNFPRTWTWVWVRDGDEMMWRHNFVTFRHIPGSMWRCQVPKKFFLVLPKLWRFSGTWYKCDDFVTSSNYFSGFCLEQNIVWKHFQVLGPGWVLVSRVSNSGLRVEFLLKTESGYLRDAGVTWFTLANP